MSQMIVGRWGKNLAVRVPVEIVRASGLSDGEQVDVEVRDGEIVIRRNSARAQARQDAALAAREMIAARRNITLGGVSIRALIDEGRHG